MSRLFVPIAVLALFYSFPLVGEGPVTLPAAGQHASAKADAVQASGTWNNNFRITWKITQEGSKYHYIYTITDPAGEPLTPAVTHLLLEVSPTITDENLETLISTERGTVFQGPQFYGADGGMQGLPNEIYGVKFELGINEEGAAIVDFYSSRPPIWGRFYAQGSQALFAQNTWINTPFGQAPQQPILTLWIPTPTVGSDSGQLAVPEPGTVLILASALAVAAILKRKRCGRNPND